MQQQLVKSLLQTFVAGIDEFLQPGRHPKWKEVNLAADVPGWERVKPAQDWLDRAAAAGKPSDQVRSFEDFVSSRGIAVSAEQRDALFRDFLAWQNDRQRANRRVTRQD